MSKVFSVKRNLSSLLMPFLRQYITVIGSAHLDIFGEFDSTAKDQIDKRGKIFYSIGGSAYNVAANLTQHNHWVYLYTGLSRRSYISSLLYDKIKENRITTKYVEFLKIIGESGFVAHRNIQTHSLSTAVSCTAVENISFDRDKLKKAIGKSRLVIVDCNLSDSTLQQIVDIAAEESPPIRVMAVGISESKIRRVQHVDRDTIPAFEVIAAHAEDAFEGLYNDSHEDTSAEKKREIAKKFFQDIASGEESNGYSTSTICVKANSRFLIIADGIEGYWIFCREHTKADFFKLSDFKDIPIWATNGSINALLAALADHILKYDYIDMQNTHALNLLRTKIEEYVRRVINVTGSTVGAELTWTEETDSVFKILSSNIQRGIKENIGKVGWLIALGIVAILKQAIEQIISFINISQ